MASLDRAYGIRGAVIALAAASIAGLVHGVLVASTGWLAVKILLLMAALVVLVIGGTVSARQTSVNAVGIALAMAFCFFWARWTGWSAITDGGVFPATAPWGWWHYILNSGVTGLWIGEFCATLSAAIFGCVAGHERTA